MRTEQILNLYFKRVYSTLTEYCEDKIESLFKKDSNTKKIHAAFDQLNRDIGTDKGTQRTIGIPEYCQREFITQETRDKIDELAEKEVKERKRIDDLLDEIKAQLHACDSYEAECAVLKIYGILDSAGKMTKYKISF